MITHFHIVSWSGKGCLVYIVLVYWKQVFKNAGKAALLDTLRAENTQINLEKIVVVTLA